MSRLEAQQRVRTDTLAEEFEGSRETVRRDLLELEGEGLVKRVHGGAVLPHPVPEEPFKKRMGSNLHEKKAIARRAAQLITPGQCVFIDAGTTTSVFAHELAKIPGVSVVPNSIDTATTLYQAGNHIEVLLLGGKVVSDVPDTNGELTRAEIARFNADVAVTSPVALHPEQGAANFDLHEAEVARAMVSQATKLIMLVDHNKLGTTSRVQYCTADQIDILVTSAGASKEALNTLSDHGVKKIILT